MAETITIELGRSESAPYVAYGDESQYRDTLVYAYVIVRRELLPAVKADVVLLKQRYAIPVEKELHCRFLCSLTGREKGGFKQLDRAAVKDLLCGVIEIFNRHHIAIRYAHSKVSHHSHSWGNQVNFKNLNGSEAQSEKVYKLKSGGIDPKAVLGMLSGQVWANSLNPIFAGPRATECEIFVCAEPSKVTFIGTKPRPAHDYYSMFLDINPPPGSIYRISPKATNYEQAFMVQLADVAAFVASHAETFHPDSDTAYYRGLFTICSDALKYDFNFQYDPTLMTD